MCETTFGLRASVKSHPRGRGTGTSTKDMDRRVGQRLRLPHRDGRNEFIIQQLNQSVNIDKKKVNTDV